MPEQPTPKRPRPGRPPIGKRLTVPLTTEQAAWLKAQDRPAAEVIRALIAKAMST